MQSCWLKTDELHGPRQENFWDVDLILLKTQFRVGTGKGMSSVNLTVRRMASSRRKASRLNEDANASTCQWALPVPGFRSARRRERPNPPSLMRPFSSSSTLDGFRSQYITPSECRNCAEGRSNILTAQQVLANNLASAQQSRGDLPCTR
jgi:hypothetical protein